MDDPVALNPFKTIMSMLINNKCWLCKRVFQRGKVKKVFMVSHLLRYLHERYVLQQEVEATPPPIPAEALAAAGGGDGKREGEEEEEEGEKEGGVGSRDEIGAGGVGAPTAGTNGSDVLLESPHLIACFEEYCRLSGDKDKVLHRLKEIDCDTWMSGLICATTQACAQEYLLLVPDGKLIVPKPDRSQTSPEDCPPGCDCDNPWQYVSAILKG